MEQLLFIKEKLKKFVGKNDVFVTPVLKFLLTFVSILQINTHLDFMHKLSSLPISLVVGLAGSFLPVNLTIVILGLLATLQVFYLSKECALIVFALFMVLYLLYFRFASKDSVAVLLTPIAFMFKIPYVMPVAMGLVGAPTSLAAVGSGVIVYNVLHYISVNADNIREMGSKGSKISGIKDVAEAVVLNKTMFTLVASFAITVIIVYVIRRLSIKYSWLIAIGVGSISCLAITIVANKALGGSVEIGAAFLGTVFSIIINIVLQYFCFDLDYNRTEKVQFEDDEYYYYVKAVPKNTIKLPEEKKKAKPVRRQSEAPARAAQSTAAGERPVSRPRPSSDSVRTQARETVRRTAATQATRSQDKGFMGLTGGRPAGEGRLKEQAARERAARAREERDRATTQRIIDDFSENNR